MLFPSLVNKNNKKAEKNNKSTLTTPNSISEGEAQYNPVKEGELTVNVTLNRLFKKKKSSLQCANIISLISQVLLWLGKK